MTGDSLSKVIWERKWISYRNSRFLFSIIDSSVIVLQPIELWTGKQLFSVLVRPHANVRVYVNLTVKEKSYTKPNKEGEREKEAMCPNDGFVYFRNSELLSGQLGKATLGQLLSWLVDSGFYSSSQLVSLFYFVEIHFPYFFSLRTVSLVVVKTWFLVWVEYLRFLKCIQKSVDIYIVLISVLKLAAVAKWNFFFNIQEICFLWSTLGKGILILFHFLNKKAAVETGCSNNFFSKLYSHAFVFSANISWVGYYFLCPLVLFINLFWDCWFFCGAKFLELCPLFWVSEWDFLASVVCEQYHKG